MLRQGAPNSYCWGPALRRIKGILTHDVVEVGSNSKVMTTQQCAVYATPRRARASAGVLLGVGLRTTPPGEDWTAGSESQTLTGAPAISPYDYYELLLSTVLLAMMTGLGLSTHENNEN